ncbi:glycine--tRNA ligase subunit beta [Helicobacter sp. MIT 14-3879]|uniref:glycine--tRNA ligase subunit beta n=1 Tax=Helicobacter sp. MIT 14-3879 TaxID=2040649 RepID=UPI0015F1AF9A|nr:glycine--tRNA ligase subunit beta [Helicobacter sp. MIT 14-3879]
MNISPLLIEIFTEELPFSAIKKEISNVLEKFKKVLRAYNIDCNVDFFYTPRRLIFHSKNFPLKQSDEIKEFFGPPLSIAYQNNEPTSATKGFLKRLNISQDKLQIKAKDNKEFLFYSYKQEGRDSKDLIENIILEFLDSLSFGKSMQWGSIEASFIRPIRNIFILMDDKFIKTKDLEKKYQFNQVNKIVPHRICSNKEINNIKDYFTFLRDNFVIYSQYERYEIIINQIKEVESKFNIKVELDRELLDEIIAITENPNVLFGEFDKKFLELPKEVIITSMKINQKYFATYTNDGLLNNGFIVVCNTISTSDLILNGNIRVLSARLEDALFFYYNDLKSFVKDKCDLRLKNIEFIQDSGSLYDKVGREKEIAKIIILNNKINESVAKNIQDSIEISKNDLLSEMVNEFGELQGIMGSYYTDNDRLKQALKEQYLPLTEDTNIPSSIEGAIVSIANKLDSILILFALNKIPSGSKDPFALRRAAGGIIKIIEYFKLEFNLEEILDSLKPFYKKIEIYRVKNFFYERLEGILNVNQSIINAAIKSKQNDILKLLEQIKALELIVISPNKNDYKMLFKRVANILTDTTKKDIDTSLLIENREIELYNRIDCFRKQNLTSPSSIIKELLGFKDILEAFFDDIMINVENKDLRENRILLINVIYEEFFKVGDIKEISF